jgi:hypothetical protein
MPQDFFPSIFGSITCLALTDPPGDAVEILGFFPGGSE